MRRSLSLVALLLSLLLSHCGEPAFAQNPNPAGAAAPWVALNFLGATGVIVPGGKLCTYAAGTTTPLVTYQDYQLVTPNANPIVMNSQGRPTTNGIYLSAAQYKFVLRTVGTDATCSTGTVVWTYDHLYDLAQLYQANFATKIDDQVCHASQYTGSTADVKIAACAAVLPGTGGVIDARGIVGNQTWAADPFTGVTKAVTLVLGTGTVSITANVSVPDNVAIQFQLISVLAPTSGNTLTMNGAILAGPYQIFSGTGTVSIPSHFVSEVYPEWWGAVADGTGDQGPAINAAITAAPYIAIQLQSGTYAFATQIAPATNGATFVLRGQGIYNTVLKWTGGASVAISIGQLVDSALLEDFKMDNTGSAVAMVQLGAQRQTLNRLQFVLTKAVSAAVIQSDVDNVSMYQLLIDNVSIGSQTGQANPIGVLLQTNANQTGIHNSHFSGNVVGVQVGTTTAGMLAPDITNNLFESFSDPGGSSAVGLLLGNTESAHIAGNSFLMTVAGQVSIQCSMASGDVLGGAITGNLFNGGGVQTNPVVIADNSCLGPVASSNTFQSVNGWGITQGSGVTTGYMVVKPGTNKYAGSTGIVPDTLRFPTFATTITNPVGVAQMTGDGFTIVVSSGSSFTIANPTFPTSGLEAGQDLRITYTIKNTSGGSMGTISWGANLHLSTWTNPANGKNRSITFQYEYTAGVWYEVSQSAGDVPN